MKIHKIIIPALLLSSQSVAGPLTKIDKWGDLFMVVPIFYGLGMSVAYDDYEGMLQLGESVVVSGLATEGVKHIVHERRPNGSDDMSFPSGHAASAFSGAMYVHKRYGWKPAVIPYALSFATGYSRVHARAHYWHDVLGGAAMSALITWVLVGKYDNNISVSADTRGVNFRFKTDF